MDHHNPGYDIESFAPDGELVRYIEVKSMKGSWDSNDASITPRQMAEANRQGERYWLYVVERADRDDFEIHCIEDPAAKIDQFLFDDGWMGVEEPRVTPSDAGVGADPASTPVQT
jgi:hypothetical protein